MVVIETTSYEFEPSIHSNYKKYGTVLVHESKNILLFFSLIMLVWSVIDLNYDLIFCQDKRCLTEQMNLFIVYQ